MYSIVNWQDGGCGKTGDVARRGCIVNYYYFRGPSSGQCCIFAGLQFLYRPGTRANNKDNAMYEVTMQWFY